MNTVTEPATTTEPNVEADPIVDTLAGALLVVRAARVAGLPLPHRVTVNHIGRAKLRFTDRRHLERWAVWCDAPVETTGVHPGGYIEHQVRTTLLEVPVWLVCTEKATHDVR